MSDAPQGAAALRAERRDLTRETSDQGSVSGHEPRKSVMCRPNTNTRALARLLSSRMFVPENVGLLRQGGKKPLCPIHALSKVSDALQPRKLHRLECLLAQRENDA